MAAFRVTGLAPVIVAGKDGSIEYHDASNPIIPWLSPTQAPKYLRLGVVEHVHEEAQDV